MNPALMHAINSTKTVRRPELPIAEINDKISTYLAAVTDNLMCTPVDAHIVVAGVSEHIRTLLAELIAARTAAARNVPYSRDKFLAAIATTRDVRKVFITPEYVAKQRAVIDTLAQHILSIRGSSVAAETGLKELVKGL